MPAEIDDTIKEISNLVAKIMVLLKRYLYAD